MTDKKEWLFVKFSDGRTYKIPAKVIAEHRATHYATNKIGKINWKTFYDEVDYALLNMIGRSELPDWATNNMDWSDMKDHAELIREKQTDYSKEWVNAEKWTE